MLEEFELKCKRKQIVRRFNRNGAMDSEDLHIGFEHMSRQITFLHFNHNSTHVVLEVGHDHLI